MPYSPSRVYSCSEGVGEEPSCSCTDCEASCIASNSTLPKPDAGRDDFFIFSGFSGERSLSHSSNILSNAARRKNLFLMFTDV